MTCMTGLQIATTWRKAFLGSCINIVSTVENWHSFHSRNSFRAKILYLILSGWCWGPLYNRVAPHSKPPRKPIFHFSQPILKRTWASFIDNYPLLDNIKPLWPRIITFCRLISHWVENNRDRKVEVVHESFPRNQSVTDRRMLTNGWPWTSGHGPLVLGMSFANIDSQKSGNLIPRNRTVAIVAVDVDHGGDVAYEQ
jgi:hypothetical protein